MLKGHLPVWELPNSLLLTMAWGQFRNHLKEQKYRVEFYRIVIFGVNCLCLGLLSYRPSLVQTCSDSHLLLDAGPYLKGGLRVSIL